MDGELFLKDDVLGLGLPAESKRRTSAHTGVRLWGWVIILTVAFWVAVAVAILG